MNADDLVNAIQDVQKKILSIPLDDSADAIAQGYLEDLRILLDQVSTLDELTRQRIRPTIELFSTQLSERVSELESQLAAMQEEAEQTQIRQQTMKAYSGTGKIF